MGLRGPAPTPVEVKRKRGTLRASQRNALVIVERAPATLEPPATLVDDGAGEWRHVLATCSWIGPSDLRTLRLYCEAIDRRAGLIATLADLGYVLYTDKGYAYLNPAHGALATTEAQLTRWSSQLGLNPSDRGRLGVAEVKARSTMEDLTARRAARIAGGRPPS